MALEQESDHKAREPKGDRVIDGENPLPIGAEILFPENLVSTHSLDVAIPEDHKIERKIREKRACEGRNIQARGVGLRESGGSDDEMGGCIQN